LEESSEDRGEEANEDGSDESSVDYDGPPRLRGSVTFQANLPDKRSDGFAANYTFDARVAANDSGSMDLRVGDFLNELEDVSGSLSVLRERQACRWVLREEGAGDFRNVDSVEEADALVEKFQKDCSFNESSVCNRLSPLFDASIAQRIHEYWFGWRPSPVLFFEPGDLFLGV
jgi:hypothetical protein